MLMETERKFQKCIIVKNVIQNENYVINQMTLERKKILLKGSNKRNLNAISQHAPFHRITQLRNNNLKTQ